MDEERGRGREGLTVMLGKEDRQTGTDTKRQTKICQEGEK